MLQAKLINQKMLNLILHRQIYRMTILNVAEKNSIAKEVAQILSKGSKRTTHTFSKFNPVYEFYNENGQNMKMTSVRGHVFDYELPAQCKSWQYFDNKKILMGEQYVPMVKKVNSDMTEVVKNIQQQAKKCDQLILWLDCDRQGEAIAFEVIQICTKVNPRLKILRAKFSALTSVDIWNAYQNLVLPNKLQADAVNYRIQIDFRLGCTFTRYQSVTFGKYYKSSNQNLVLSYGPCQMPTLGFVVQRYLEIKNFKPEKFWFLKVICVLGENQGVEFKWCRKNIRNQIEANLLLVQIFEKYQNNTPIAKVIEKNKVPKKRYRPFPLTTVQLQKLATDKLRMSSAEVMEIAEKLYQKGYISYPRTQTNSFPKTMNMQSLITRLQNSSTYGPYIDGLLNNDKFMKPKVGNQDDQAHSPIHPVKLAEQSQLNAKQWKVYDMICRYFLACCSKDAIGNQFQTIAQIGGQKFKASYLTIQQRNYLQIYPYDKWVQTQLPEIPQYFTPLITLQESKTTPPGYLTQSDLIGLMQKNQIGTDSTIHEHIQTIQTRKYAVKTNNTFKPTNLGVSLICSFKKLDIPLPQCEIRRMIEQNMNKIAQGQLQKSNAIQTTLQMMIPIYDKLMGIQNQWLKAMKQALDDNANLTQISLQNATQADPQRQNNPINNISACRCPSCGKDAKIRYSRASTTPFIGCTNFPTCKWTQSLPNYIKSIQPTDNKCTKCQTNKVIIEAKNILMVEPRMMQVRFQQQFEINPNKLQICLQPQCDPDFYNFTSSFQRNITASQNSAPQSRQYNTQQSNYHSNTTKNVKCYKCNKMGHYSKDCVQQSQSINNTQKKYTCFKCGKEGHIAPKCPNGNKGYTKSYKGKSFSTQKQRDTTVTKKGCMQCGHVGRHTKNSTCSIFLRRKNKNNNMEIQ